MNLVKNKKNELFALGEKPQQQLNGENTGTHTHTRAQSKERGRRR